MDVVVGWVERTRNREGPFLVYDLLSVVPVWAEELLVSTRQRFA